MIICHFCLNDQIIDFLGEVKAHNKSIHGSRHLFHLSIGDRDTFPIQYSEHFTSCKFKAAHTDNTYFCNWLLPPNNESLRELDIPYSSGSADTPTSELEEISMGFPSKYIQESGKFVLDLNVCVWWPFDTAITEILLPIVSINYLSMPQKGIPSWL